MFSKARGKAKHELSRCRVFSTNSDGVHDELVYVQVYFEFISTNAFSCAHRNIPWEVASHDGRNAGRTESRFGSSSLWPA